MLDEAKLRFSPDCLVGHDRRTAVAAVPLKPGVVRLYRGGAPWLQAWRGHRRKYDKAVC